MFTNKPILFIRSIAPAESPTVAIEDDKSKVVSKTDTFSVILHVTIKTEMKVTTVIKINTVIAFSYVSCGIVFLNMVMFFFPLIIASIPYNITTTVTVFIPPAMLPGAPPISIKNIIKSFVASLSSAIFTVDMPAVLAETDWNDETKILSLSSSFPIVLLLVFSKLKNKTVPNIINTTCDIKTNLVCSVSFFIAFEILVLFFIASPKHLDISSHTKKPRPPN